MNKVNLFTLLFALVFTGSACATSPQVVDFDNPDTKINGATELRSIDEAREEGRFVNTAYLYSLSLTDAIEEPVSLDYLKDMNEASALRFIEKSSRQRARIEVQDPETLTLEHLQTQMTLPLKEFVNDIIRWNREDNSFNSETKEVSDPEMIVFAERDAYTFTVTESFKNARGERRFDEKMTYILLEHADLNFVISYPEGNSELKSLIESMNFHRK